MTVEIWSRDSLETVLVAGNMADVVNAMNISKATGKQFIVMDEVDGSGVALEINNVVKMRQKDEDALSWQ